MHIQSYQIHNVLNVYRRQLSQVKTDQHQQVTQTTDTLDSATISSEGKNQTIMEKVADRVLQKITSVAAGSEFDQEVIKQIQHSAKHPQGDQKETEFIFNTIVGNNQKETRSIAVDNSQVLMNRLNELAQAAVKRRGK